MKSANENLIQALYESRKLENRRIHEEYVQAMEIRTSGERNESEIIETILSDLPEETNVAPHNFD